eukprot:954944-Pelagomonas_calceolata.AAC.15
MPRVMALTNFKFVSMNSPFRLLHFIPFSRQQDDSFRRKLLNTLGPRTVSLAKVASWSPSCDSGAAWQSILVA